MFICAYSRTIMTSRLTSRRSTTSATFAKFEPCSNECRTCSKHAPYTRERRSNVMQSRAVPSLYFGWGVIALFVPPPQFAFLRHQCLHPADSRIRLFSLRSRTAQFSACIFSPITRYAICDHMPYSNFRSNRSCRSKVVPPPPPPPPQILGIARYIQLSPQTPAIL